MKLARLRLRWTVAVLGLVVLAIGADAAGAGAPAQVPAPVNIPAAKDNTLFESASGGLSSGAGRTYGLAGTAWAIPGGEYLRSTSAAISRREPRFNQRRSR